jgi:GINS complex protein
MAPSTVSSPLDPSRCAAFLADDTPIEVVPAFDLDRTVPLFSASVAIDENGGALSSTTKKSLGDEDDPMGSSTSTSSATRVSFGPVKAGIPCALPLWLAVALNEKSLAKISKPRWMETDNLVKILQEERTSGTLVVASSSSSSSSSNHHLQLPFYYYEISQRLSKLANVGWNRPEIRLLVEDIAHVRIDKLRHTFQKSLAGLSSDAAVALRSKQQQLGGDAPALSKARLLPDTFADVTGICAMELAVLGPFFVQALNDVQKMEGNTTKQQHGNSNQEDPQPSSARDTNDRTSSSSSSSSPPPPPRRRDRLRRFR